MTTTAIPDILRDIIRHTHGLGLFEMVKIRGEDDHNGNPITSIETMDPERSVLVKGRTHAPVPEFQDHTLGLSRLAILDGLLRYPGFSESGAQINVVEQERNGETVPTEIHFCDVLGSTANYRFMLADVVNQQLKDVKFKGANQDLSVIPSQRNLTDMSYFAKVLGKLDDKFTPVVEKGDLMFLVGDAGSDRGKILITQNVKGNVGANLSWKLSTVLSILMLSENGSSSMSFDKKGLLCITVDSGISEYTYLLPAQK